MSRGDLSTVKHTVRQTPV